jgi:hypothetical protein
MRVAASPQLPTLLGIADGSEKMLRTLAGFQVVTDGVAAPPVRQV